jgi:transposase, IS30 family
VGLGTRLTDEERARIAELAATRLPSRLIAREVGRSHRAVWSFVHKLRRPVPAERRRSPLRLSLTEREEISRGVAGGESFRCIAGRLGRAPSTISREVAINGGRRRYRACRADTDALARARRPQGGETGDLRAAPGGGGGQTREALVTPADRGVAVAGPR